MKSKVVKLLILNTAITALSLSSCKLDHPNEESKQKPNIIYILADDLGYGDLSCYGQEKFSTPNIDKLAAEGMQFTQHYAGSTVCAPSRSVLMTGLHTGHTPSRGNIEIEPLGQFPIPDTAFTVAELFKASGYVTGAFGKWGLGSVYNEGDPQKQGFDHFFGYYCQALAHRYYPEFLWDDGQKILLNNSDSLRDYSGDIIHRALLDFIKTYKDSSFFLYAPYTLPHAELIVPEDKTVESNRGAYLPEKEYKGNDYFSENFSPRGYVSQPEGHAIFVSMVQRLDKYVGEIESLLDELGLAGNTMIFFTSDNGPHKEGGADPVYFNSNGNLRGTKRDLYEGGIRVPFIVKWPGKVEKGTITNHISAFYDFFPTMTELLQSEKKVETDGISFLPVLLKNGDQKQHDFLYWEFHEQGGKQAVRMGNWKAVRLDVQKNPDAPLELYNLENDPKESNNISEDHPDIVKEFKLIMSREHVRNENFLFEHEKQ